jgi:carbonic anhydrase
MRKEIDDAMKKLCFVMLVGLWVFSLALEASASGAKAEMSPDQALKLLKEGNARFVSGKLKHPLQDAKRRRATATEGQKPFATVLTCSDSRVPAEILFDRGIGDLFVVRVAGNVADTDQIGTMEYGVDHLATPVLVVLGHTKCGAVTAVVQGAEVHGSIPALVDNIVPAAAKAKESGKTGDALIQAAIDANIWQAIADTLRRSPIIGERLKKGEVQVVGALYDLASGKVTFLGPHPEQEKLLKPQPAAAAPAPASSTAPAPAASPTPAPGK